jgi:DNA-binding NarL/FixJ family response regulator
VPTINLVTANGQISLVLVEDHTALRRGMELLLGREEGIEVVATGGDAREGFALIRAKRPDVALLDINMPGESGIELTKRLLAEEPELGILLYTGLEDEAALRDALDCGARGFVLKTAPPAELLEAIRGVAAGGSYVDPRLRSVILSRGSTERIGVLSPREREVLDLLSRGLTGEDVAKALVLSPETIRTHVRNAMDKLEAHTRVHAIAIALRSGEIEH